MAKFMKAVTVVCVAAAVIFGILNIVFDAGVWLSLGITFGTIAYHFVMRLIVGHIFDRSMNNHADYTKKWYQVGAREMQFYKKLKVKKWKNKMPTYDPALFSPELHTWDEIAQAMCQAELVHETIVILSFLPIISTAWWGSFWVFLITSICAAVLDSLFVMMQRYNRTRIMRLARRDKVKEHPEQLDWLK